MSYSPESFDPLSTEQIKNTICERFERQELVCLENRIPQFDGSGLYAIYYRGGSLDLYAPLNSFEIPVYVGQKLSSNRATGITTTVECPLRSRLSQHRSSLNRASLPLSEFFFRALVLPDVHADLGEDGLRVGYQPVWNSILTGFGSNGPGDDRKNTQSKWDTVHTGRKRNYGSVRSNKAELIEDARAHIMGQIKKYSEMPWPHPTAPCQCIPESDRHEPQTVSQ